MIEERLVRRFGDDVRPWIAQLPSRLGRLADAWGLRLGDVFDDGNSAVTVRAERDGEPLVLKVSPDLAFAARQADVLRAFGPTGRVPRLLAHDDGALLMTWAPGRSAWPAPARFAALLDDLHTADPHTVAPRPLADGMTFLDRARPAGPVTQADLDTARDRCAAAAATQGRMVLLHGDLHVDNLLDSGAEIVAIDPQGTLGEREFDAVDYVLAADDIEARRDALLRVADLDGDRLDTWCRAVAAIIAASLARRGLPADAVLRYARA